MFIGNVFVVVLALAPIPVQPAMICVPQNGIYDLESSEGLISPVTQRPVLLCKGTSQQTPEFVRKLEFTLRDIYVAPFTAALAYSLGEAMEKVDPEKASSYEAFACKLDQSLPSCQTNAKNNFAEAR